MSHPVPERPRAPTGRLLAAALVLMTAITAVQAHGAVAARTTSIDGGGGRPPVRIAALHRDGDDDFGAWLLEQGRAPAQRHYPTVRAKEKAVAQAARKGPASGTVMGPPQRQPGELGATIADRLRGCRIKGNISREGERIYHLPGGQYYAVTRIDPLKGERWFCSEAEARAAGWRRSRR